MRRMCDHDDDNLESQRSSGQSSLRRSARSCSQTIPEALAKIWRAAGSKVKAFSYMVRKLRSIAFQRCI